MTNKAAANEQAKPDSYDVITTRRADPCIKANSVHQESVPHNRSGQKKRKADGTLKNEATWSMKELKYVLQDQCVGETSSETRLTVDVDNLMRRIAVLEDLKPVRKMRETFPARHLPRKDQDCDNGRSRGRSKKAEIMDWKRVQEDTLR
ncbi:hypothetical protein LTR84_002191 [Exophiala bonariae]|uniref:Uncharacterized protein n=1 Tax=Exophiala bonariae TaxID=1690606 RepID=A0AAV9NAT1_9EURO|nr:hypothetical protein LTR84_002191 [Exophiala bonariae]